MEGYGIDAVIYIRVTQFHRSSISASFREKSTFLKYLFFFSFPFNHVLGTIHRVHREAPGVQQVSLETLQHHPQGRRLVRPEQRAKGHDNIS